MGLAQCLNDMLMQTSKGGAMIAHPTCAQHTHAPHSASRRLSAAGVLWLRFAGVIHLFPSWPVAEPASFTTLRAKGAFLVSASWDPKARAATGVCVTATVASPRVALAVAAFGGAVPPPLKLRCLVGSAHTERTVSSSGGRYEWPMASGEVCAQQLQQ